MKRHRGKDVGAQQGRVGRDRRTPVVAHDHGGVLAEGFDDAEVVVDVVQHPVGLDLQGGRGAAVAAHVDGHRPEAGRGDGGQLVPPRVPRFGEAVHQQHQRAAALLDQVDTDAPGVDGAVVHRRMAPRYGSTMSRPQDRG